MASLEFIHKHRYLVLLWSCFEILLFSAIAFGWPALVVVLKQEGFYHELCHETTQGQDVNRTNVDHCVKQEEMLSLIFTIGASVSPVVGLLFIAPFFDHFGPRKARLLCCLLFVLTFLFFVLADKDRPNFIFPGIVTLWAAGLALLLTIFQIANMFDKWKSSVISLFNGAFDSSAVVLLFFKLVYDAGVPLRSINICYFLLAILSILAFTFILPPYSITSEHLEAMNRRRKGVPMALPNDMAKRQNAAEPSIVKIEQTEISDTSSFNGTREAKGEVKTPEKNSETQQGGTELRVLSPSCEVENINTGSTEDSQPRLINLMLTTEYLVPVFFLSVCNLRLVFYVGSLNSYLEFMSDNDIDTVSHYTNWFGIIQFAGFIFAPFVGLVMDWKPKKKENNEKTDIGFVLGFFLTSFVALLLNILVLVPVLSVQYVSFVAQVVLRAFVYAVYAAFILHKFPMCHFGKLYGAGHIVSSMLSSTQYGLFTIAEEVLEKDPFWVNVGLLVLCLFLNILPALLWFKERTTG